MGRLHLLSSCCHCRERRIKKSEPPAGEAGGSGFGGLSLKVGDRTWIRFRFRPLLRSRWVGRWGNLRATIQSHRLRSGGKTASHVGGNMLLSKPELASASVRRPLTVQPSCQESHDTGPLLVRGFLPMAYENRDYCDTCDSTHRMYLFPCNSYKNAVPDRSRRACRVSFASSTRSSSNDTPVPAVAVENPQGVQFLQRLAVS